MTERRDMEAIIEAILFVAHDPVSGPKLLEVFSEREREAAAEALQAVVERFQESPERGVMVDEVAGGLRLVTRPDLHGYLRRFFEVTSQNKLSMPALETLTIIAYRQPITGPEIQELRNVSSAGVIKKLLERRLIRIAGRKEVVGKPFLYATTREFLMHFGLKSLKELPPLEQFEEMFADDVEGPVEGQSEPDQEEQVDLEAAALNEKEDEAVAKAEAEVVEQQREAADAQEEAKDEEAAEPAEAKDEEAELKDEETAEPAELKDEETAEPAELKDDEVAEPAEPPTEAEEPVPEEEHETIAEGPLSRDALKAAVSRSISGW